MQTRILGSTVGRIGRALKTMLLGAVVVVAALAAAPGAMAQVSPPDMDVNQDAVVDVVDVQLTVNIILAIFTQTYTTQGDANYDGSVDVVDVQTIVNRILGFTTPFSLSTRPVEAAVSTAFSSNLFAYGGTPPYSYSATGLPAGVSLSPSGTLSGSVSTAGSYDLNVTVTQSGGPSVNGLVQLVIGGGGGGTGAPVFVSSAVTDAFVGQLYTYNIVASGNPTPGISITNRPTWLTLAGTTLSGTPSMAHIGYTNTITLTAFNGTLPNATQSFVIAVNSGGPTPAITSTPNTTATLGQLYSYTAIATGTPPASILFSGLPAWLTQNNRTISGTPSAGDVGLNHNITVTASNGNLPNAVQNYTLSVVGAGTPPVITSTANTVASLFVNYSYTITATGSPAPTIFAANLPLWASLSGSTISGMPGPGDEGTTGLITVTAANGVGTPVTQSFSIVVSKVEIPAQAPEVLFEFPATTSTGTGSLASNAKLVVVFSEEVVPTTMTMGLSHAATFFSATSASGGFTEAGATMSFATGLSGMTGRVLVIQPSAVVTTSHAGLTLWGRRVATGTPGAGIRDVQGNGLVNAYSDTVTGGLNGDPAVVMTWTRVATDSSAPTRTATSPTASSSNNSANTTISVTFSEPINPATLAANFLVSDGQGAVPGAVSMNYATLATAIFTPSRTLSGTVQVAIAGVQDLAGNAATALQNFTFSVGSDNQAPVISFLTVNNIPSHINGDVSFGGGSVGGGRIQVPPHGFTIDVRYSEPGGSGVSRTLADHHVSADVPIGPAPANTNVAGTFPAGNVHIGADRALFVVPSTMAFAIGQATITVRIRDVAGNLGAAVTYTITVKAPTNEILPLEGSPETWQLYFNRDHENTIFNFPGNIVSSGNNDSVVPNATPDFTEDLTGHGFMGGAGSSNVVNSGGGLQIQQAARNWVINRLIYHVHSLYGLSVPFTDGNPNPGFAAIMSTASPTTATASPNLRFVNSDSLPPAATPRMAFGGIPGTLVLGRASFDPNNLTRSEDNGTAQSETVTQLGVFTLHDLKVNYNGNAPSTTSPVRHYFDATSPFAAAGTPQPLGTLADDAFIVDPMQNPATFTGARLTRYTNVMRAMDAFARGWAFVTAHEIGHSLGLVKDNPPGAGLYGGMPAAFANSTQSHLNLLPFMQGSGTNIMAPSLPFERSRSRFSAFNELEFAYLLGTVLAD